jgi:hypothetical protein
MAKTHEEMFGSMKSNAEFYQDLLKLFDDKTIGSIMHVITYALAEVATENDIPRRQFIAHFVERFDKSFDFLEQEQKGNAQ